MTPAALKFFEVAANGVTIEDVKQFCPNDPGYPDYVREFGSILTTRIIPLNFDFDITETIGLTRWGEPDKEFEAQDALRFRRFRLFTNAVGLAIILGPNEDGWHMGCNYYAINLFDDIEVLEDDHFHNLLLPVLDEMHQKLSKTGSPEEALFYLLAQLFIGLKKNAPHNHLNELADQLIAEEAKLDVDDKEDRHGFLWQRTFFDQLHPYWRQHVEKLFPLSSDGNAHSRLRALLLDQPVS